MPKGVYHREPRSHEETMASLRERITNLSQPIPMCGCWIWMGSLNKQGYGCVAVSKYVRVGAHRAAWMAFKGAIPDDLHVLHDCDVPACCNPDHLHLGTHQQNVTESVQRKRWTPKLGSEHGMAKLTEKDVLAIRASSEPQVKLAAQYGLSSTTVSDVRKRRIWRHV